MTMSNLASYAPSLASYAPSAYELLHRVGLERRRSRAARAAARAGWIGLGVAMGSGLVMLLNSRGGPIVREHLKERVRRAREYVAPSEGDDPRVPTPTSAARGARGV